MSSAPPSLSMSSVSFWIGAGGHDWIYFADFRQSKRNPQMAIRHFDLTVAKN